MMIRCPDCKEEYDDQAYQACPFCEVVVREQAPEKGAAAPQPPVPPPGRKQIPRTMLAKAGGRPTMLAQDPLQEPEQPTEAAPPAPPAPPPARKRAASTRLAGKGARLTMLADQDMGEAPAGPMAGKGPAPKKPEAPAESPVEEPVDIDPDMLFAEEPSGVGGHLKAAEAVAEDSLPAEVVDEVSVLDETEPDAAKAPPRARKSRAPEADADRKSRPRPEPSGRGKLVLAAVALLLVGVGLCFGGLLAAGMVNSDQVVADLTRERDQARETARREAKLAWAEAEKLQGERDKAREETKTTRTERNQARQEAKKLAQNLALVTAQRDQAVEGRMVGLSSQGKSAEALREIAKLPPNRQKDPSVIVARARAEFAKRLAELADKGGELSPKDAKVRELLGRLKELNTPGALLERIALHEYLEDWQQVQQLSEQGLKTYADNAAARAEFAERLQRARSELGASE